MAGGGMFTPRNQDFCCIFICMGGNLINNVPGIRNSLMDGGPETLPQVR